MCWNCQSTVTVPRTDPITFGRRRQAKAQPPGLCPLPGRSAVPECRARRWGVRLSLPVWRNLWVGRIGGATGIDGARHQRRIPIAGQAGVFVSSYPSDRPRCRHPSRRAQYFVTGPLLRHSCTACSRHRVVSTGSEGWRVQAPVSGAGSACIRAGTRSRRHTPAPRLPAAAPGV